jgi:hypothetical protein
METMICSICYEKKPISVEFFRWRKDTNSFRKSCTSCDKRQNKPKRIDKNKCIQIGEKLCTKCNIVKPLERFNKAKDFYRSDCKDCCLIRQQNYSKTNRSKLSEYQKLKERERKLDPEYRLKITEKKRNYHNNKKQQDPFYRVKSDFRKLISSHLRRTVWTKKSKAHEILGCDWNTFKTHIEKQFIDGMTWYNHGINGWHYDHIIPIASAKTEEEFFKLNHFTNIQPLWAQDNLKKGAKMIV